MATLENWASIMYSAGDAVGVDQQPLLNNRKFIAFFFLFFVVVCSFFVLNLIVASLIDRVRMG